MSHAELVARLNALPGRAARHGARVASCPAHDDRQPSLSVGHDDRGAVLLHCLAGCDTGDVVAALGCRMADLFPDAGEGVRVHVGPTRRRAAAGERRFEARYVDGSVAGEHCRSDDGQGHKRIWWDPRGVETGRLMPFLTWDLPAEDPVVVVEGERATFALRAAGFAAVGTYGSSCVPSSEALAPLASREVVLWPDADATGRQHMAAVASALEGRAARVRVITSPTGAEKGWDAADADPSLIAELIATATDVTADASIRPIATFESMPVEWLWPGWLPRGTVTLFDGNPGEAKSTAMMNLIARVTTGSAWPDGTAAPAPADVLIITREDDPSRVLRPRLEVAGADLSHVLFLDREFVLPRDADWLRGAIAARPGIVLVFIDPLFSHIEGTVRTISDNDVRTAVMTPLSDIASRAGIAILAMRHYSKDTTRSALLRGAGSLGGLVGAARMVWSATADPDDDSGERKLLGVVKSNYARKPQVLRYRVYSAQPPGAIWLGHTVSAIEWLGTSAMSIDDILAEDDHESARGATEVLVAYLRSQGGEASASACGAHLKAKGYGSAAQKSAKKRAGVISRKDGFDGNWSWCLPEEGEEVGGATTSTPSNPRHEEGELVGAATPSTPSTSSAPATPTSSIQSAANTFHEEGEEGEAVDATGQPTSSTTSRPLACARTRRGPSPSTSSTSSTSWEGREEGEVVEGGEEVGPSVRAPAREDGPLRATRPDGSVWCRDFAAHQFEHRSVSSDPACLVCAKEEVPS